MTDLQNQLLLALRDVAAGRLRNLTARQLDGIGAAIGQATQEDLGVAAEKFIEVELTAIVAERKPSRWRESERVRRNPGSE